MSTLVATADRELVVNRSLDYRAPREAVRRAAQDRAVTLLQRACKLGDARSCWRALELPNHGHTADSHALAVVLGKKCLAGQMRSCWALRPSQFRSSALDDDGAAAETDALCAKGLAAACYGASQRMASAPAERRRWLQKGCDLGDAWSCEKAVDLDQSAGKPEAEVAALTRRTVERATVECGQGFAASCLYLAKFHRGDKKRVEVTAKEGCAAGMYADCDVLTRNDVDPTLRAYAMEERCTLQGYDCSSLADTRTDPTGIRDAYEHGCQLGDRDRCLELVKRYRANTLPEPVPGRARDLADYLCAKRDVPEACSLAKE
ncbi:MAG TPA: hypothetical protein VLM79_12685 [Kofleriaceae bacterium]|nr:hypothetical protein [Kofleriaceae bacterium]